MGSSTSSSPSPGPSAALKTCGALGNPLWAFLLLCKVGSFPGEGQGWVQSWEQAGDPQDLLPCPLMGMSEALSSRQQ